MTLNQFLEHKPLFYEVIDTTRMPLAYQSVKEHLKLPRIVHIVGTNGKGTTGRFLAQMLRSCGLHVGHYTSPHIVKFNERIWIDGQDIDDAMLELYHQKLLLILSMQFQESLSYFEYTTLLAMLIFCDQCDFVVLEAGLGGEFDATNVFDKILSIITPIGLDHQAFLGENIEAIAQTKINSVKNDCVIAKQYEKEVYSIARDKASQIDKKLFEVASFFDKQTCENIASYVSKQGYSTFLGDNFTTAFCALRVLGYDTDPDTLQSLSLRGRCQKISPNVTIDVGHNQMAALALVKHFGKNKVILVYNSLKDKDYHAILEILKPIILEIQVIDIQSPRAVEQEALYLNASSLGIPVFPFLGIKKDKEYLVFGSFLVVEAFLKGICEK